MTVNEFKLMLIVILIFVHSTLRMKIHLRLFFGTKIQKKHLIDFLLLASV
jgi:hypothetical protein